MRKFGLTTFLVFMLTLLFSSQAALGDWDPGDGHKMHYPQLPELDPNGLDVLCGPFSPDGQSMIWYEKFLADDFLCMETGLITDIHIWTSNVWDERIGSQLPPFFSLVIYENLEADQSYDFSRPGAAVWNAYMLPIAERIYATNLEEQFYDPNPDTIWGLDSLVWQYNFEIDPAVAFYQEAGQIYWLGVHRSFDLDGNGVVDEGDVITLLLSEQRGCGWKTSGEPQYEDDAVWTDVDTTMGGPHVVPEGEIWLPLIYPPGHPRGGQSIDLAFVITGEPEPGKPLIEHSKWSQPPIERDPNLAADPNFCGWDEPSVNDGIQWKMVADDYRCIGNMPVTSLHWWGSHVGWDGLEPPDLSLQDPSIIGWHIGFWNNVPAFFPPWDADWSSPEFLLHELFVDPARVPWEWVGIDSHPSTTNIDSCFQYTLYLDETEYFWQGDHLDATIDDIFWVSITAVYDNIANVSYPWGWKTRPWSWEDDAITIFDPDPVITPLDVTPLIDPTTGESMDVAFELDTDPNWIKHEQHYTGIRNWPLYHDEPSLAVDLDGPGGPLPLTIQRLVADDWPCEQCTPITAIVWHGSYLGYMYEPCMGPVMPPMPPDYFQLRIWTDVPAGVDLPISHPNDVVWAYDAYEYDEVLVGYDKEPYQVPGPPREPVFRYSVRIPETEQFWQKEEGAIYWLSVVAVYEFGPPEFLWGWTNHPKVFMDNAVDGNILNPGDPVPIWIWNELFDQEQNSQDMSFILYTEPAPPEPTCWNYQSICYGDADMNGNVDGFDFILWKNAWFGSNPDWWNDPHGTADGEYNPCADFDRDGGIDGMDFILWKNTWTNAVPYGTDCNTSMPWPPCLP